MFTRQELNISVVWLGIYIGFPLHTHTILCISDSVKIIFRFFIVLLSICERRTIMYEIFEQLLQKNGVTAYKVSKETGVTQSTLSDWKRGRSTPKTENMKKIADYFNVSVEYLMTGNEAEKYYLDEETAKLAQEMFEDEDMRSLFDMKRNMSPERFQAHMDFMKNLYKQEKGENF